MDLEAITLWLNAFIPDSVCTLKGDLFVVEVPMVVNGIPLPTVGFFSGDQREFSDDINASARMHSEARIEALSSDAPQLVNQRQLCGESHEVDEDGNIIASATASTDRMNFFNLRGSQTIDPEGGVIDSIPGSVQIDVAGSANLPLVIAPDIDHSGTFIIDRAEGNVVEGIPHNTESTMPVKDLAAFMDFGRGVNGVNGKVRGLAVTGPPPTLVIGEQFITSTRTTPKSFEELHEALGLTMDGSASFELFDGSEKFNLSRNFNSYSVFLVVNVTVVNSARRLQGEQLVPDAVDLLRAGQLDLFRQKFGDFYVKGIETGGQYCALIEVESTGATDQDDLSSALEVAFGVPELMGRFLERLGPRRVTIVPPFQRGGTSSPQEPSIGDVLAKALSFPGEVLQSSLPLRVELQDYALLGVPTPPDGVDLQRVKAVLQQYVENRATLLNLLNDIDYIKQHLGQFVSSDEPLDGVLGALERQAAAELDTRTRLASDCFNDLRQCAFQDPHLPSRDALPPRTT